VNDIDPEYGYLIYLEYHSIEVLAASTVNQILVVCTLESVFRARLNGVMKGPPHPLCSCHVILPHPMVGHSVCSWTSYSYYGMMDPSQVYHRQVVRRGHIHLENK
jgi:hypothetical protein